MASRQLAARQAALISSGLFDSAWYLKHNPDVAAAGHDPMMHFLKDGSYEGRSPGPDFDAIAYLTLYPDVVREGVEPWLHFAMHGRVEGRIALSFGPAEASILAHLHGNPTLHNSSTVVEDLFRLLLGREPDMVGLAYYKSLLEKTQNIPQMISEMMLSDEYKSKKMRDK
ncbi:DUF4214 domain-containing protein [Methylobacterium sp. GXS13]|uniref:DUF4214 domain-containing protein n=1 Tax=Methylobacterium sp. GXS13 TaxID=1730094 RepID=UPI0013662C49|nr:DUF4214 domain-containing protein [Methylobacterium sp. GXS13]